MINTNNHHSIAKYNGFTIVELLVVIVVLGILAAIVVAILKPGEIMLQASDSSRVSDIKSIDQALNIASIAGSPLGSTNTIYTSLPDTSATCANLTLPTIPTGWQYACVTLANVANSNGTGWIPVDLSPNLSRLPIDPTNLSTSNYYTYVTDGAKYHLSSVVSSEVNKFGGSKNITATDGGSNLSLYETGSNLFINPMNGYVINGSFEYAPPFVAAQNIGSGHWIDGTAAGSTTRQSYALSCGMGAAVGDKYAQFDPSNVHTGLNSFKIHINSGAYVECRVNSAAYYSADGVRVLPNTTYKYSVWMKSENVAGSAGGHSTTFLFADSSGAGASVTYSGSGGTGTATGFSASGSYAINKPWTQYTGTFTTGATAVWFHPEYRVYGHNGAATLSGDFWFDDLVVYQ